MTIAQQFIDKNIWYKEYDFQARKKIRGEIIDKKIATENLLLFRKIFYQNGINFFLLYGTLLGAIREKDFISHDTDTDIGIFEKDREKLLKIIPILLDNGFELIRTKEPDDLVTFIRNDEYIDIGIFRKDGNYYKYQENLINNYFLDKLDTIEFLEKKFYIPSQVEKFLEKNYGSDWRIPRKNEPALNLGYKNCYYRFKRGLLRRNFVQQLKKIVKIFLRRK